MSSILKLSLIINDFNKFFEEINNYSEKEIKNLKEQLTNFYEHDEVLVIFLQILDFIISSFSSKEEIEKNKNQIELIHKKVEIIKPIEEFKLKYEEFLEDASKLSNKPKQNNIFKKIKDISKSKEEKTLENELFLNQTKQHEETIKSIKKNIFEIESTFKRIDFEKINELFNLEEDKIKFNNKISSFEKEIHKNNDKIQKLIQKINEIQNKKVKEQKRKNIDEIMEKLKIEKTL